MWGVRFPPWAHYKIMEKFTGKTILIVDDEPDLREIFADEFKSEGATVLEAENGTTALEIAKREKLDAVITDIRMPGGGGIELLDNLKKLSPNVPVVMLITGFADFTHEDAYHKGADAIFSKPCNLQEMMRSVERALMPEKERWVRKFERVPTDLSIEFSFQNQSGSIQSKLMNIGRGGIFLAVQDKLPPVGSTVYFKIGFQTDGTSIEGRALCRWTRKTAQENFPVGAGFEFLDLSSDCTNRIMQFIQESKTKSYIPKT